MTKYRTQVFGTRDGRGSFGTASIWVDRLAPFNGHWVPIATTRTYRAASQMVRARGEATSICYKHNRVAGRTRAEAYVEAM